MPTIKLWIFRGACSLAPHILLNEVGVPYSLVEVKFNDNSMGDLQKVNPKAKIPVLEIDDQIITENIAILTAIAQFAPEKNLLGTTDLEKLRVYEWLSWIAGTLHGQAYGGLFRPGRYSDDESAHESIKRKGLETVQECYQSIDDGLRGVHAVGNKLTVVDPYLYVFWRWGATRIPDMEMRYPKYAALVRELGEVDSVKRTLEKEEIESFIPGKS